jgi:NAD(P)-dependent dehydrogenase (short-subunit alcohol dehydrogenase family)
MLSHQVGRSFGRAFFPMHFLHRKANAAVGATDTPLAEATVAAAPTDDINVVIGKAQIASIPKGRMAYATDIADAVIFLLSDWSSFITGQCIPVNGGNF